MINFILIANFVVELVILFFEVPERLEKFYNQLVLFLWALFTSLAIAVEFATELPAPITYTLTFISRFFLLGLKIYDHRNSSSDRDEEGPKDS